MSRSYSLPYVDFLDPRIVNVAAPIAVDRRLITQPVLICVNLWIMFYSCFIVM